MNKNYIEKAKELIKDFMIREYHKEEELTDEELKEIETQVNYDVIKLMYTTYSSDYLEDINDADIDVYIDELEVQVEVDIKNTNIAIYYNNICVWDYTPDSDEFLLLLRDLEFDTYCNLDELDTFIDILEGEGE